MTWVMNKKIHIWIVAVILFLKWEYTNIKLHKNITKVCYIKYGLQYSLENEEGLVSLGSFYKSWSANQKSEFTNSGFWLVDWKVTCRDVSRWGTELCRMYLWQFGTSSFNWGDYRSVERTWPTQGWVYVIVCGKENHWLQLLVTGD